MIPKFYYTKEILQFIDEAISDGVKSYDLMPEADREKLTSLCIFAAGEQAHTFITENPNLDKAICKLRNFLVSGKSENAIDLMTLLADGAVKGEEKTLTELFDERYSYYLAERKMEAGFRSTKDLQTGDQIWIK